MATYYAAVEAFDPAGQDLLPEDAAYGGEARFFVLQAEDLAQTLLVLADGVAEAAEAFWAQTGDRWEQRRHDLERPILPPGELYLSPEELRARIHALLRRARFAVGARSIQVRQTQARQEKYGGHDRRRPAHEVGRAGGAEQVDAGFHVRPPVFREFRRRRRRRCLHVVEGALLQVISFHFKFEELAVVTSPLVNFAVGNFYNFSHHFIEEVSIVRYDDNGTGIRLQIVFYPFNTW